MKNEIYDVALADFDESEIIENATITVEFVSKEKVHVQLAGGHYKPSLGCTTSESKEAIIESAIEAAEKFVADLQEEYEIHQLGFNCDINNTTYYLRTHEDDDCAQLIAEMHSYDEYRPAIRLLQEWEDLGSAWEFIIPFKTGDHHDYQGLHDMLDELYSRRAIF